MKKTTLFLLIILFLTACNNTRKVNEEENKDNKNDGLYGFQKININCPDISNIIDYSIYDNLFITTDGKLYEISYDKVFSNNTNCDLIDSDKKYVRFIKAGILDSENEIYSYDRENRKLQPYNSTMITMPNQLYESNVSKTTYKNIIYSNEDFKYGENVMFYFYYDDKNKKIYNYSNDLFKLNPEPLFSLPEDEKIEYLTTGGIKTNKGFYIYGREAENKIECEKYADIKCIYKNGFYKLNNENFIQQYENIQFIVYTDNLYFILDKNNNFYTNVMGG